MNCYKFSSGVKEKVWGKEGVALWAGFFFFSNFILSSIFTFLLSNIVSVLAFEDSNWRLFSLNSQEETKSYLSVLDVFHLILRG